MLYESLATLICLSAQGNYTTACNKAGQAALVTAGAPKIESQAAGYGESKGKMWLGADIYQTTAFVAAATVMTAKQHELTYKVKLPKDNVLSADYVKPDALLREDNKGGSLGLGWSW